MPVTRGPEQVPADASPRRGEGTRARILDAAMHLFAERGLDGTTVRDLTARCGLTDAALYYYFRSKREVLDALLEIPEAAALNEAIPAEPMDEDILMGLVDLMLDAAAMQAPLTRLITRQALAGDRTAAALRDQTMALWRTRLTRQFRRSHDEETADHLADTLSSLVYGLTLNGEIEHGAEFATVLESPAFRAHVRELVRLAIPLDRTGAEPSCVQDSCAQ